MPPTSAHFNGGVNLPDAETVMRAIVDRVQTGLRRIPDGETGERASWIGYQLPRFEQTAGLEATVPSDVFPEGYDDNRRIRLDRTVAAADIKWPDLGYAVEYRRSYETFTRLRGEGLIPAGVRFQVQYPTPLASIAFWVHPEHQDELEPSYEGALFADLASFLADVPADDVAVQWDVAVEFGILEKVYAQNPTRDFDDIVSRLARYVDQVPVIVPTGLHLCYGDYYHRHFAEPTSVAMQVRVLNAVACLAARPVSWASFTVPQRQTDPAFFGPLSQLSVPAATELDFSLVAYYAAEQGLGITKAQETILDELLAPLGFTEWGVGTECGMGRVEPGTVAGLLDRYAEILGR